MPTRSISLTDHHDAFIENRVSTGDYQDASDVVRAGLRLLEQSEQEYQLKLERLREAVRIGQEAYERGEYEEVDVADLPRYLARLAGSERERDAS